MSRRGITIAALLAVAAVGCTEKVNELVVSINTDMAPPKDFDHIEIVVKVDERRVHRSVHSVGEGLAGDNIKLPATIGLVAEEDTADPVTVEVAAYRDDPDREGALKRTQTKITTTIPSESIETLPISIQWLCTTDGDVETLCDPGLTCVAGRCVEQDGVGDLDEYLETEVFGGSSPSGGGTCFDTVVCFDHGEPATAQPNAGSCIVDVAATQDLSIAVVTDFGTDGICGERACYVPLDRSPINGWSRNAAGDVEIPASICDKIEDGTVVGVQTTTACPPPKSVEVPTCGPWSSVGEGTPLRDSAACTALCDEVAKAGCEFDSVHHCYVKCLPMSPVCDGPIDQLRACAAGGNSFTCDGTSGREVARASTDCTMQDEELIACRSCAQQAQNECESCECGQCTDVWRACVDDANCSMIYECSREQGCRGTDCNGPCAAEIAAAGGMATGLFNAITTCTSSSCSSECGGT